jgi:hypothetical protein
MQKKLFIMNWMLFPEKDGNYINNEIADGGGTICVEDFLYLNPLIH